MPRPRKNATGDAVPTRDRIIAAAIDLFSRDGYKGASVRAIARAVKLNEASLYNHFPGKAALLEAAIGRLEERLMRPGFSDSPADDSGAGQDLASTLFAGAMRFFARADPEILRIWRILVIEQYRNPTARATVQDRILRAPRHYFRMMFENLQARGLIRSDADTASAADTLASALFEFSFASNLSAAWGSADPEDMDRLRREIAFIAAALA